jgi:hypothetical protein
VRPICGSSLPNDWLSSLPALDQRVRDLRSRVASANAELDALKPLRVPDARDPAAQRFRAASEDLSETCRRFDVLLLSRLSLLDWERRLALFSHL